MSLKKISRIDEFRNYLLHIVITEFDDGSVSILELIDGKFLPIEHGNFINFAQERTKDIERQMNEIKETAQKKVDQLQDEQSKLIYYLTFIKDCLSND